MGKNTRKSNSTADLEYAIPITAKQGSVGLVLAHRRPPRWTDAATMSLLSLRDRCEISQELKPRGLTLLRMKLHGE
jgi:hypothetical protein